MIYILLGLLVVSPIIFIIVGQSGEDDCIIDNQINMFIRDYEELFDEKPSNNLVDVARSNAEYGYSLGGASKSWNMLQEILDEEVLNVEER